MILMFIGISIYQVLFLKCSEKTSYPIFHDPRPGAEMTKLFMKDQSKITLVVIKYIINQTQEL